MTTRWIKASAKDHSVTEWFPMGTSWRVVTVAAKGDGYIFVEFQQVDGKGDIQYGPTGERRSEGGRH